MSCHGISKFISNVVITRDNMNFDCLFLNIWLNSEMIHLSLFCSLDRFDIDANLSRIGTITQYWHSQTIVNILTRFL
jgi:hypothetical protein